MVVLELAYIASVETVNKTSAYENTDSKHVLCSAEAELKVRRSLLLTRNLRCRKGIHLLILVTSHAWSGSRRRSAIRDTWGTCRRKYNTSTKSWQTFFVVGNQVNTTKDMFRKHFEKTALHSEVVHYRDIIEGDFEEMFYNLPYKLQVAFEWASLYCNASYVLKTDDDVFVNTETAFNFLGEMKTTDLYTGHIWWDAPVHREGNYRVKDTECNGTHYPPFVSGSSMIFTCDVIQRLASIFPKVKVFKLDDVHIGILMYKLGINATDGDPDRKKGLWEVWLPDETENVCEIYTHAIVRHIHGNEKLWCMYKLFNASVNHVDVYKSGTSVTLRS